MWSLVIVRQKNDHVNKSYVSSLHADRARLLVVRETHPHRQSRVGSQRDDQRSGGG